jgi:hypothetical protein
MLLGQLLLLNLVPLKEDLLLQLLLLLELNGKKRRGRYRPPGVPQKRTQTIADHSIVVQSSNIERKKGGGRERKREREKRQPIRNSDNYPPGAPPGAPLYKVNSLA